MPFCANCGSAIDGRFCARCGTPVSPPPTATPAAPGDQFATPTPVEARTADLSENVASALCYVLGVLTGILFLVLEPYNKNRLIRFHAFQAIFLWVAWCALWIVVSVFSAAFAFIGLFFFTFLHFLLMLAGFVVWATLMYRAYNGRKWVLPVIGPLAEKQA